MTKHEKKMIIVALILVVLLSIVIRLTQYEFSSIEDIKLGTIFLYEVEALLVSAIVILIMVSRLRIYKGCKKFFVVFISCVMIIGLHLWVGSILFSNINLAEETTEDFVFSLIRLSASIGSMLNMGGFVLLNFLFPDKKTENTRKIEEL